MGKSMLFLDLCGAGLGVGTSTLPSPNEPSIPKVCAAMPASLHCYRSSIVCYVRARAGQAPLQSAAQGEEERPQKSCRCG